MTDAESEQQSNPGSTRPAKEETASKKPKGPIKAASGRCEAEDM